MGFFSDDDDEVDEVPFTQHQPQHVNPADLPKAAEQFKPADILNYMDMISGQDFGFVRGLDGNIKMTSTDVSGTAPAYEPVNVRNIDVNLPQVGRLPDVRMQEAAALAVLTQTLRNFGQTIEVAENTAPEALAGVAPMVEAFKNSRKRALDKGFDIMQNGIDKRLAKLGLANSSTAIGTQIALMREKTDAELDNIYKVSEYGDALKKQKLESMFKLGNQIVQEGVLLSDKYKAESANELTARGQDLHREGFVQTRAAEQANLNLREEMNRNAMELGSKQIKANLILSRNPANVAMPFLTNNNAQGLAAVQGDASNVINSVGTNNTANYQQNAAQTAQQNALTHKFSAEKQAESNPFGEIVGMAAGQFAGNYMGAKGFGFGGGDMSKYTGMKR